jgi:hypothetical protein
MGLEQADAGSFAVGETVKLSYVDQEHKRDGSFCVLLSPQFSQKSRGLFLFNHLVQLDRIHAHVPNRDNLN